MLEFIVLGQIPGTNIYISFWQIFIGVVSAAILVKLIQKVSSFRHKHQKNKDYKLKEQLFQS